MLVYPQCAEQHHECQLDCPDTVDRYRKQANREHERRDRRHVPETHPGPYRLGVQIEIDNREAVGDERDSETSDDDSRSAAVAAKRIESRLEPWTEFEAKN